MARCQSGGADPPFARMKPWLLTWFGNAGVPSATSGSDCAVAWPRSVKNGTSRYPPGVGGVSENDHPTLVPASLMSVMVELAWPPMASTNVSDRYGHEGPGTYGLKHAPLVGWQAPAGWQASCAHTTGAPPTQVPAW